MSARILVAIPVRDRFAIATQCIPTVRAGMDDADVLTCFNDGSAAYGIDLHQCGANNVQISEHSMGIERQRRMHFEVFAAQADNFDFLYLTDSDAVHDLSWKKELVRLSEKHNAPVTCGYNTEAHARLDGNTVSAEDDIIWRRVAPGISYLLRREDALEVARWLAANPTVGHWHWDWQTPALLGHRCAVTRQSVVDHIGNGGMHHPADAGWDGGDRALNPTPWLVEKRKQIIAALQ